jgi:hypothetical protein
LLYACCGIRRRKVKGAGAGSGLVANRNELLVLRVRMNCLYWCYGHQTSFSHTAGDDL